MTSKTFSSGTVIDSAWLNDVNTETYKGAINVKMAPYNAVGDGVTDDTTAIQSAITAAQAINYGSSDNNTTGRPALYFPPGVYLVGSLSMTKRMTLIGDGSGTTFIKLKSGVTTSLLTFTAENVAATSTDDAMHSEISGITLQGNRVDNVTTGVSHGIYCPDAGWTLLTQYTPSIRASDVVIQFFTGDGIYLGDNRNWALLDRVIIRYCNDSAFVSYSYDTRATACDFGECKNYGVREFAGGGNVFTGCNLYGNTINYVANNTSNAYTVFEGCAFDYALQNGVSIDQATGAKKFWGCRFYGNSKSGTGTYSDILVSGASCIVVISNCEFIYSSAAPATQTKYLIETASSPKNIIWKDNVIGNGTTVPYAVGITSDAGVTFPDSFVVRGLVSGSNSAATANWFYLQEAITCMAGTGGVVKVPPGNYYTNQLFMYAGVTLEGSGEAPTTGLKGTTLTLANNQNKDLIADANYLANINSATYPWGIRNICLDGNRANNSAGSCCVIMCFSGTFTNVTFQSAKLHGAMVTAETADGTAISNTVPNNRFDNCYFNANSGSGLYGKDTAGTKLSDVMVTGCAFNGNGQAGYAQIESQRFAGWTIVDSRTYGGWFSEIKAYGADKAQIVSCNFELNVNGATNSGANYACIDIRYKSNNGDVVVSGNVFSLNPTAGGTATDVYCGVFFSTTPPLNMVLSNNSFRAETITTKRAVHGASSVGGICFGNTFSGFSAGTEMGTAWANWSKLTVTGAKAGNAALTSLLTQLDTLGIIKDSST